MEIVQIEKISDKLSFNNYIMSDMYCRANLKYPTCQNPVRIYYESWAGGRHGEAGLDLKRSISKLTELIIYKVELDEQSNNVWQYKMVHELGSTVERIGTNLNELNNEVRLYAIKINDELKK